LMPTYLAFGLMLMPAGAAVLTFTTAANSTIQLSVAPTMRGRIMALYMLLLFGGTPLGGPLIGWLAAQYGGRAPIVLGGAVCFLAACVCGLLLARSRRDSPRWRPPMPFRLRRHWASHDMSLGNRGRPRDQRGTRRG